MVRVRPEAQNDVLEAAQWYDERQPGLGAQFVAEIDAVFQRITEGPERFRRSRANARVASCHRFPYAIYFLPEGDGVVILAVLHQRCDRGTLDQRLDE